MARDVPISDEVVAALRKWVEIRGSEPGPLFFASAKSGDRLIPGQRMSGQSIYDALVGLGEKVDIPDLSPHNCRRTFITDQLSRGIDVLTVAKMVGHKDPRTTMLYDRREEDAMREAADKRLIPR
jgi:integrase